MHAQERKIIGAYVERLEYCYLNVARNETPAIRHPYDRHMAR